MKIGSHHTPEVKERIALEVSRISKANWANPNSGLRNRKFPKTKASGSLLGKTYEEIYGEEKARELREVRRQAKGLQVWLEGMSSEQRRAFNLRMKMMARKSWDTPEHCQRNFEAQQRKPSIPETLFADRLDKEFPNTWKYVGDGQVWIARANPDFINTNGQKLLIETYTPYFKEKDYGSVEAYVEQRGSHFLAYGFKTLFLDLYEKDWDSLIEQVRTFAGGK